MAQDVTQKWSEAWVEAARPPVAPWHIAAQQIMVLCLEHGALPEHEMLGGMRRCFPELAIDGLRALVEQMIDSEYLVRDAGVLAVGPETERW